MLDEIVKEFLVESTENLDQLDRDLMALEDTPDDRDRLSRIFRAIHTIKGTSGFLAFPKLEHITHVGENLLVLLRDGVLRLNEEIATALLALVDAVRGILSRIETENSEGEESSVDLIETLERLSAGDAAKTTHDGVAPNESPGTEIEQIILELCNSLGTVTETQSTPSVHIRRTDTKSRLSAESSLQSADRLGNVAAAAALVRDSVGSVAESSVRIEVQLLDKLMNLVGELVLARNQILQFSQSPDNAAMASASQRLNLITTELQESVMKTRMQPIRNAWSKLPRVVRDLAISCGKQVQLKMEGAATELDRTILEAIKDPLMHIVRNSIDHGIEAPEVRLQHRKPAEGMLWLKACHSGGQVIIDIADDGAGINVERIRQKAVDKKMVTAGQAAAMSDREVMLLILLPGFSTAAEVTNLSGRGVGMDVVRTNVERIGGTLEVTSVQGQGTRLRIKIPLTLAIVPALVVTCGVDRFCIPQTSLVELLRLDGDRTRGAIEMLHSVPVYRLRGRLLPLIYLDEEMGLHSRRSETERQKHETVNIVVLQAEDRQFGLIVGQINDTQELVVKPLGRHLRSIGIYAGSTIMGDGAVSLILDVVGLARLGHVLTERGSRTLPESTRSRSAAVSSARDYLIVDPGDDSRMAIPLESISRLEAFRPDIIERNGGNMVVQYRGKVMRMISLTDSRGGVCDRANRSLSVVVYNNGRCDVGVMVGRIVDIVTHDPGCPGDSVTDEPQIIAGRVTRVVDLQNFAG